MSETTQNSQSWAPAGYGVVDMPASAVEERRPVPVRGQARDTAKPTQPTPEPSTSWVPPGYGVTNVPTFDDAPNAVGYSGYGSHGGIFPNLLAGAVDMATLPAKAQQGITNLLRRGYNAVTGSDVKPHSVDFDAEIGKSTGFDPSQVQADGFTDRAARAAGGAVVGGAMMPMGVAAGAAPTIGRVAGSLISGGAKNVIAGVGGQAGMEGAQALVPEDAPGWAKTGAGLAGGLAGGVAAMAGPAAVAGIGGAIPRAVVRSTLAPKDPETLAIIGQAQREGIVPTVGETSPNRFVRNTDSTLRSMPMSGYGRNQEQLQNAVNGAANRSMGIDEQIASIHGLDPNRVTPEHFNLAKQINGNGMQAIETQNRMNIDTTLMNDLRNVLQKYGPSNLLPGEVQDIHGRVGDITSLFINSQRASGVAGSVPGEVYANLTHFGTPLTAAINGATSPNLLRANVDIKRALERAWERSLPADQHETYMQLKANYANMKTLEPMAGRADIPGAANPSTGDIIPDQLRGAVNRKLGPEAAAHLVAGDNRLNDLAKVLQRLREPRTSNTTERSMVLAMNPAEATLMGAVKSGVGALAGRTVGAALRTPAVAQKGEVTDRIKRALDTRLGNAVAGYGGAVVNEGGRNADPETNPETGLPQYNLKDAQKANSTGIARGLADAGRNYREWATKNQAAIKGQYGGQGFNRAHQIGAALTRGPTILSKTVEELKQGSGPFHDVAKSVGYHSAEDIVHAALTRSNVAQTLSRSHFGTGLNPVGTKVLAKTLAG